MRHLIGSKSFYKSIIAIAAPLVLQQLLTSSVQLVDNLMVGSLPNSELGSVAIINQLYFVVILITFGAMGGAGIFSAQYFGSKDFDKLRQTFRFKIIIGILLALLSFIIFSLFSSPLISAFTNNSVIKDNAEIYLKVIRWSAFPWILNVAIANTFRETGVTKPLLKISIVAILTNTILNYLLIFGHFGFPELGIYGAAIATLIARMIEFSLSVILVIKKGQIFNSRVFEMMKISPKLFSSILIMAFPLMLNEALWSGGQTVFFYAYTSRGTAALEAVTISSTISQLVFVTFGGIATAVAVMVGNTLGKNELEQAKDNAKKLIAFAVIIAIGAGIILFILSFFIVDFFNASEASRAIARFNIRINALFIPVFSFNVAMYFTLRSGGDTKSTFLMDAGYMWVVPVPIALILAHFTQLPVTLMFLIVQSMDIPKMFFGLSRYRKENWVKNLAIDDQSS
jgi:putative MATE family efflux protein